jgi:hypothetical protein
MSMSEKDKSHEILILHLNLQRAAAQCARARGLPFHSVTPWNSDHQLVREAWQDLTHPRHLSALEDWIQALRENNQIPLWSEEALKECQARAAVT